MAENYFVLRQMPQAEKEFLEVLRPERVVMSWRWQGGLEDPGESRLAITLRAVPEGTELTLIHSNLHDEETRRSHEEGWTGSLDKLDGYFLQLGPNVR